MLKWKYKIKRRNDTMITLSETLMQEIVDNSNHLNTKSVEETVYTGDIEIYKNQEEYQKADYDLEATAYYIVLSNGHIVHFIGG